MITVFQSTKYARPQFSLGLAPIAVWLSDISAVTVISIAVAAYLSDRAIQGALSKRALEAYLSDRAINARVRTTT
jgi:hypothetical protein